MIDSVSLRWLLRPAAVVLLALLLLSPLGGCSTVRPMANNGQDLVENPQRSIWVRIPSGLGAAVGILVAVPVSVLLLPTYPFESACVETADGHWSQKEKGDIYMPLVYGPYEYGSGMGASILGWPFERCSALFNDPPGPPPGTLDETPELPPGEQDPAVHPPGP